MKFFQKQKIGNHRIITVLGFKIISYKKEYKIPILNKGKNNIIIGNYRKARKNESPIIIINGNNNVININEHIKICGKNTFTFNGNNNILKIKENTSVYNSHFDIRNNITFSIGKNCLITNTTAIFSDNGKISIGNNFCNSSTMQLFAGGGKNMDLTIGNDCMFSREIVIYTHDGHPIYDRTSNEEINKPKNSVVIGNNVWLGHGSHILKNAVLPDNTVVGAKSVVTKVFEVQNTIIAGNPAKVCKRNIYWKKC